MAAHRSARAKAPLPPPPPRRHVAQLLRDVAALFGPVMATRLAEGFGGRYVYLPVRARPDHPIAKATSLAVLAWLIQRHYPNARIVIPLGRPPAAEARVAETARLRKQGLTVAQIAERLGVHVRTVQLYVSRSKQGDRP